MATLDSGTTCSSWNHSGHRLATGSLDGILSVYDSPVPSSSSSSSFTCTSKVRVSESSVAKIVWLPSEYGDAVACICEDGSLSIWEEVSEDTHALEWKSCKSIKNQSSQVLDVQFGVSRKSLKMVAAYSDGYLRVFELLNPLELKNWQLQVAYSYTTSLTSRL
ncbi:hypothetical protein EUTSA_v10023957mg [Eutrema salsugineum]|uniref:Anaphase-promoting complex subunit 4 WD40 domain-containing protein n=1 Tax=Eutrema salsugineum TaxID=72664 RepID=V4MCG3_EUTSA|nr:hypothetical protein EUTSA_v10023957mg [Eutrema salsugineum]